MSTLPVPTIPGNRYRSTVNGRMSNGRFSQSPKRGRSPTRGQSPAVAVGFADRSMYDRQSILREREDLSVRNAIEGVFNELGMDRTVQKSDIIRHLIAKVKAKENQWPTIEADYTEIVERIFLMKDKVDTISVADFNAHYYQFVFDLRDEIEQIKDSVEKIKLS